MAQPLHVALVWHMHQPLYRDALTGRYSLPWVRLHATKDYLHMARVLAQYPDVHATVNFVPSLVDQLNDYTHSRAEDKSMALSRQEDWSLEEREFLLSFFFSINWDRFVRRYPPYARLLALRDAALENKAYFSSAYFRDLVAWFNLAWIDPGMLQADPTLARLAAKGQGYSSRDVEAILAKQLEIVHQVIPAYRALQESGQVELTTSPYYHPILPLLIDSRSALEASPGLALPAVRYAHAGDAREQVRRAVASHTATFGRRPRGLWPSEGSVSQATIDLLAETPGLAWVASDEGILGRSLGRWVERDGYGHVTNPELLYQPYRVGKLSIVFRDRALSDRIGFVYKHMEGPAAAQDLLDRLREARARLPGPGGPYLVSIILDGENCWEEYPDNGDPFLHALYDGLSRDPNLRAVTVSEHLEAHPPRRRIARLAAGSWINQNLETWIGEPAQNQAWESLASVRERLLAWQRDHPTADPGTLKQAWEEIYIAEGSDWFWWYCSHNHPAGENLFDREFRRHLANVYRLLALPCPAWIEEPIRLREEAERAVPKACISPPLDAAPSPAPAWARGGYQEARPGGGAMRRGSRVLRRLCWGYDRQNLYLRLEASQPLDRYDVAVYISLSANGAGNRLPRYSLADPGLEWPPLSYHREVRVGSADRLARLARAMGQERWRLARRLPAARKGGVLEVSVPLAELEVGAGASLGLVVAIARDGVAAELMPTTGHLELTLEDLPS